MSYYFTKKLNLYFDKAIAGVTEELKKEGFGILTDIDVKATLKKKLDVEFRKYRILGACNPPFAYKALQAEDKIGTMLPCNVIVQEISDGQVRRVGSASLGSVFLYKALIPRAAIQPVGHIRDETGDLGQGIGLFERPVNDSHDFVIILCEPAVTGMELIGGHVFRPYDDRIPGVFRIVGADDSAFLFKFLVESGSRIRDENIDGDAVDLDFFQYVDGTVENVRGVGVEAEDDPTVNHDAAIVCQRAYCLPEKDILS